ncbi:MAG: porphobilinogen deaminase [Anaerocolumna sp.]|nr:porphobilinogen deaminase [Anaerocolumna sp.]
MPQGDSFTLLIVAVSHNIRDMQWVYRMKKLKVGTRKSKLALVQTETVIAELKSLRADLEFEIVPLSTLGDRIQSVSLTHFGGKGAFVAELEEAMLKGDIDLAVHSAKDLPLSFPKGLDIIGVSRREDPRDVLVTRAGEVLREKAVIGTGSPRRKLQLEANNPYVAKELRGNVNTRLGKLSAGEYDGLLLAAAGLKRLQADNLTKYDFKYLDPESFIPAAAQGIIAVEGRTEQALCDLLGSWSDKAAREAFEAEREVIKLLGADCTTPLGVYAEIEKENMTIHAIFGNGENAIRVKRAGLSKDRIILAGEVTEELKRAIV